MTKRRQQRIKKQRKNTTNQNNNFHRQDNDNYKKQSFHFEFLNQAQRLAWEAFEKHDVLFLLGPAGVGKSQLACAFAVSEVLANKKEKIVLTRPVVEAGESLGYLPGSFEEKVAPYIMPMYDCINRCIGKEGPQRELINKSIEVAPIAYLRGRTFHNSVCIFDEAQNATFSQIKLFITRFGKNSKVIITGDPNQSDIPQRDQGLMNVVKRLEDLSEIGIIQFKSNSIVRHPLISSILEKLEG
jgi:phosphate starvation-inducible PhoH-like protein